MKLHITARHFKMSPAVTETVEKAAQGFEQYYEGIVSCDVVAEKTDAGDTVEFIVHVPGTTIVAKETEGDLYKAIHAASDHAVRQLQKLKSKKSH